VFKIGEGVVATGAFQLPPGYDLDEGLTGMKIINYRGGVVRFRLPSRWLEEYDEEGGGRFHDPEVESGTLYLNVMTFQSEAPVSAEAARGMLQVRADNVGTEITSPDDGLEHLHYQAEEEDGEFVVWYWEVADTVPPHHARMAIFAFSVEADLADDEEVQEALSMLRQEIPRCEFSDRVGE